MGRARSKFQVWGACPGFGQRTLMGSTDVWLQALDLLRLCVAASGSPPAPAPQPISQARGTSSWGGPFLYLLPLRGQRCPHLPKHGNPSGLQSPPHRAASLFPPSWPPCTSCAQDDRLPRCCLCWRHGTEARDPETKRHGKGGREGERKSWVECEGNGGRQKSRGERKTHRYRERESKRDRARVKGRHSWDGEVKRE